MRILITASDGTKLPATAMIDTGSNTSLISDKLARELDLGGEAYVLKMNLAGGSSTTSQSTLMEVEVSGLKNPDVSRMVQVFSIKSPCGSAQRIKRESLRNHEYLLPIIDELYLDGGKIDLLLGVNMPEVFIDLEVKRGTSDQPIAKRNIFGWTLFGAFGDQNITSTRRISGDINVARINSELDIKSLLFQDQLGVKPTVYCTCSDNQLKENRFIRHVSRTMEIVDNRVSVHMPWNEHGPPNESNYPMALTRMYSKERHLQKSGRTKMVNEEVGKLLKRGVVKTVESTQINHSKPEFYLPMHEVLTPGKTTEIRLVFDASAKWKGMSLNDRLEKGPCSLNSLVDVMLAWRWEEIAFAGDISKMFNQILVREEDQIFHRFIWRDGVDSRNPTVYQWLRLNFGDKPAPDLACSALKLLANQVADSKPAGVKVISRQSYVDDICGSGSSSEEIERTITEVEDILSKGSFDIKMWHSNAKDIDTSGEESTTILGMRWNKISDKFTMKLRADSEVCDPITKRIALSLTARFWDPLGILSPATILFRIDLQDLWSQGFSWDEELPSKLQEKWLENIRMINLLLKIETPRLMKPADCGQAVPELHGFSDAGDKAYGAVVFLRWEIDDRGFVCIPILAKAFVAPLKKRSIPRLELMALVLLTRLVSQLENFFELVNLTDVKKTLWCDSRTVLSWIKTPSKDFKSFVSCRVAEIQESAVSNEFRYIPSKLNPADHLTRGMPVDQLTEWWKGPEFLRIDQSLWPDFWTFERGSPGKEPIETLDELDEAETEKRVVTALQVKTNLSEENPLLKMLLDRMSSFSKIRRSLAILKRFVSWTVRADFCEEGSVSVNELQDAELAIWRMCQESMEIEIERGTFSTSGIIPIKHKDGLWRAHGRLENIRELTPEFRNPIILPGNHRVVRLLLRHLHENKLNHCGSARLKAESRQKFWITELERASRSITGKCIQCRKLKSAPSDQLMGQLPDLRTSCGFAPFTSTGIDMFGPITVRLKRRTFEDCYGIIFVCMTTRAVHLELVTEASSEAFIMAFRRFACTRGHPRKCWSDRGSNFIGSQKYLREVITSWNIERIKKVFSEEFECDFEWQWNIPYASNMNGAVESLIKSVRKGLSAICGKNNSHTEEQWRTIFAEISYTINSRPLYPASSNVWEAPPITPNDLLLGRRHNTNPLPEDEGRNPRDLVRSVEGRATDFWNAWKKYFAPNLLPRNKWFRLRENLQVGDLVLDVNPKLKRGKWTMAVIDSVQPGRDGVVRKTKIRTQRGIFERPANKLCLIATKEELSRDY